MNSKTSIGKGQLQKCALCSEPINSQFFPFCSARCKMIDLHRWLSGSYRFPVEDEENVEDSEKHTLE